MFLIANRISGAHMHGPEYVHKTRVSGIVAYSGLSGPSCLSMIQFGLFMFKDPTGRKRVNLFIKITLPF